MLSNIPRDVTWTVLGTTRRTRRKQSNGIKLQLLRATPVLSSIWMNATMEEAESRPRAQALAQMCQASRER